MASKYKLDEIPISPGCYLFKNSLKEIIYVGKAKQLRKRVSSYFQKKDHDLKTQMLVDEIDDIDFIATRTEVEALILENSLIKKYYPRYNLDLKDSQRYAYLHITDSEFPWIETERKREESGEYYGPFVSGSIRKVITDVLTRNFRILTRKPSPRLKKIIAKEDYLKRVGQARKILRGKVDKLINDLEIEMDSAAAKTHYEYALTIRNQINALKSLKEKQIMEFSRAFDSNIINYVISGENVYLLVFSIRKGVLEGKQEFEFPYKDEFLDEFLLRYYDDAPIPLEVILPQKVDDAFEGYLTNKRKRKVNIIVPEKGDKKLLLDLVLKNVNLTFFAGKERLIELQKALNLPKIPIIMECFDISHLSGTNTVASMVRFENGIPDKSNYRKFKIRNVTMGDDFLAMSEVIERRFSGSLSGKMKKPDLIIIDGGLGQLNVALNVLAKLKLKIPVISLAKRFEEIYVYGKSEPVVLQKNNKGLQVLQAIRDEAHRFAISYQRLLRNKEVIGN
jgi:excinuclease ABC subunit C